MKYWKGLMNAPLDVGWKCETCGANGGYLIWGLINGQCRCDQCHTQYWMRVGETIVTKPITGLRPECVEAAKAWWEDNKKPISEAPQGYWESS